MIKKLKMNKQCDKILIQKLIFMKNNLLNHFKDKDNKYNYNNNKIIIRGRIIRGRNNKYFYNKMNNN